MINIKFTEDVSVYAECVLILVDSNLSLPSNIVEIDGIAKVSISDVIKTQDFKGKFGDTLVIPTSSQKIKKIVLFGMGEIKDINLSSAQVLGGKLYSALSSTKMQKVKAYFPVNTQDIKHIMFNMVLGLLIRSFKFEKYFTKKAKEQQVYLNEFEIICSDPHTTLIEFEKTKAINEGIKLTKNLVLEPPNILTPIAFAQICKELEQIGVKVEVLDEDKISELNMNALLGVAQGSSNKPRVVTMHWSGASSAKSTPVAFVGKGVTFDSGGLSLKPAGGMIGMKYDMSGAAIVTGLMKTLALRKANVNVVGVIGLVENMPDGNAQRPEDVVTSMSGQTIEILNTDAEGRLVLADVLWFTQNKFKPSLMVDLATLTGAIRVCLAEEYAGLFSNDKDLADKLYESGIKTGEKVWQLPLGPGYDKMINSQIADVKNIGGEAGGGSITAAQFLQRFVNDTPWAHLDIAAMAMTKQNTDLHSAGSTAFGVRLLNQFVVDYYER